MGLRGLVINKVFRGRSNIWRNVVAYGAATPTVADTAVVGTIAVCGTGSTSVVWLKVYSGSTGTAGNSTGLASANGTWVRLHY